jgi:hypothetical protein
MGPPLKASPKRIGHPYKYYVTALGESVLLAERDLMSFDLEDPAVHDAVPPGVRLRLERERGPRFELELDDGQEPLGEQHGVGERAPNLLRKLCKSYGRGYFRTTVQSLLG